MHGALHITVQLIEWGKRIMCGRSAELKKKKKKKKESGSISLIW